jgi:uncharacterized phage infection (PIP) family protein YhgE
MEEIHDVVADGNSEVSSIVQYLNGGYRQYKAEHPKLKSLGIDHDDTDNK